MANAKKPEATKEAIENANKLWTRFTIGMKWGVIVAVACLALMAVTLV